MKVIVIGAGIGGLTTAIALEKHGIEVALYEQAATIQAVGAGLTLWANAITVYDALGMGDALIQLGIHEGQGAIRDSAGVLLTTASMNNQREANSIASIFVHRAELHHLLSQQVQSPVHLGYELSHYAQSPAGVTAHFSDGSTAQGDLLIAADGIHSAVRRQMIPQLKPIYSGYTAYRAVLPFAHARVGGVWGESWGCGSRFGLAPLSDDRVYWFGTENVAPGQYQPTAEALKAHLQALYSGWHEPIPQLIAETSPADILHHDIYDLEPLTTWIDQHVVLLGDAAHAMTPNLGQGACQAIEDAYALAHYLASASSIEAALANYQLLRLPRAKNIMQQSRQIGAAGQINNPMLCWVRNQAVRLMPASIRDRSLNTVVNYDVTRALSL